MKKIEARIEAKVKEIINKLKTTHQKFEDVDFGPTEADEHGTLSLYGPQKSNKAENGLPEPVGGNKYPEPKKLVWERPLYDDNKFSEETDDVDEESEEVEDDEFGFKEPSGPEVLS